MGILTAKISSSAKLTSCLNWDTLGARRGPGLTTPPGAFPLLELHEKRLVRGVINESVSWSLLQNYKLNASDREWEKMEMKNWFFSGLKHEVFFSARPIWDVIVRTFERDCWVAAWNSLAAGYSEFVDCWETSISSMKFSIHPFNVGFYAACTRSFFFSHFNTQLNSSNAQHWWAKREISREWRWCWICRSLRWFDDSYELIKFRSFTMKTKFFPSMVHSIQFLCVFFSLLRRAKVWIYYDR